MALVKSIVMVDDDADDRDILKSACLTIDSTIDVSDFDDGEEAIKSLPKRKKLPDLIFLDLNMPKFNGVEILEKLKKNPLLAVIPVVIYSTSFDNRVRELCTALGALAVIEKPSSFSALCAMLVLLLKK